MLPAIDPRVRAAVAQMPIADGADWLHSMRREYEWLELLERIAQDRRNRVLTGKGEMVHPATRHHGDDSGTSRARSAPRTFRQGT